MNNEQKIYGRWEYSLGDTTSETLFQQYRYNIIYNERGIQIGGICAAKNVDKNTAILLTYDEESEFMLLALLSGPNVKHNSYITI